MIPASIDGGLAALGLDPPDEAAKRLLFTVVWERARTLGLEPAHAWWVPGRIEVFGKHTDYCGGHSLVAAVPRGFAFAASPREDGYIRAVDAGRGDETLVTPEGQPANRWPRSSGGWRNYLQTVVRRLSRNFPGERRGADLVFASDLPSASGMSSSSALVVGAAAALCRIWQLDARAEWRASIRSTADAAGYYACIENGRAFGALSGETGVGTHGGSEDHTAILCSAPRELSAWRFVPIEHAGIAPLPDGWTFVVASSGVAADKTGTAREAYNRLARQAQRLLETWSTHAAPQPSLRHALASEPSAPQRLRAWALAVTSGPDSGQELAARLEQFLREDPRALQALEAFRSRDIAALASLGAASQRDAGSLLHNQVPETEALVQLARDGGAAAASSFGAGFGGSVWALVERKSGSAFATKWLAAYTARFPARRAASTFVATPGPGLTRLL